MIDVQNFLKYKLDRIKLNHLNRIIYDKIELFFTQKESNKYEHAAKWKDVPVVVCNWLPITKKTKRLMPKPHQPNFN